MSNKTYKGYTVHVHGISHYIYRPGQDTKEYAPGYAQSMAAAKRWINEDIYRQDSINLPVCKWI